MNKTSIQNTKKISKFKEMRNNSKKKHIKRSVLKIKMIKTSSKNLLVQKIGKGNT